MNDWIILPWGLSGCAIWTMDWWPRIRADGYFPAILWALCLPIAFGFGPLMIFIVLVGHRITR